MKSAIWNACRGITAVVLWQAFAVTAPLAADAPDFETQLGPLLVRRCIECHQGADPAGGLVLNTRDGLLAGGDSGPVIDSDHPQRSSLLQRVHAGEMPPPRQGRPQPLPADEIRLLQRWVLAQAPWPQGRTLDDFERTNDVRAGRDWWSLQPVVRPAVPRPIGQQPDNPIDAFVRSRLQLNGLTPAPPADRRTLIRRVYYDLIGLPPAESEIAAFVADESPDAWHKVIDRLLAMPQYGERWGRYWLDLARYADTSGYERDQEKPFAWKYRDWVISAFNRDLPYDQFIMQQLAGDEMPNRTADSVIATGFLRLGTWNDEPNDPEDYRYERLEDLVHTTSVTFLAMTIKCARCHAHKFDPITQADYYRAASAFWPGPLLGDRKLTGGPSTDALGFDNILGWTDVSAFPQPIHLLKNGDRHQPLGEVRPASFSFVPALVREFDPPGPDAVTTTRRLQLARWIADQANPLTSRVLVNRLWQHHFGQGIVRTPSNFGFLADPPTHPELLDWLAAEFDARGRRLKPLHRLILTSQTWQQSSVHPDAAQLEQQDASNRLWWRYERRRLDAEALRDSLLTVSGELDRRVGGPGFRATVSPEALEGLSRKGSAWSASPAAQQRRRSIYMYLKRGLLPPMMTSFDLCDPTLSCGQRDVTTVPTQALALLNNDFVHQRAEHLAAEIARRTPAWPQRAVQSWSRILGRTPDPQELTVCVQHLRQQHQLFVSQRQSPRVTTAVDQALILHLQSSRAIVDDAGRVVRIPDLSGHGHHAVQPEQARRPSLRAQQFADRPAVWFSGNRQFLKLSGALLDDQPCTIIAVISDQGTGGHREILSNWNGAAGNSTSSLFLGLTAENRVRFSDAFLPVEPLQNRQSPFVISAVNDDSSSALYQNGRLLGAAAALPHRRLDTPWVIGQQGNIDGEYWQGAIAEIQVFDRGLSDDERQYVESRLARRYAIATSPDAPSQASAEVRALASLCHVLMNSNEFLYVD